MQAIILAAGMGKRLGELTQDNTKCMVKVNGKTLIERLLSQLDSLQACKLKKIIIVTGYKGDKLRQYIDQLPIKTTIEYVHNPIYATTNNIYSLWLAKDYLMQDDTLLFESDLIFNSSIIEKLLTHPHPSLCLVSKYESWMDGTVVKLGENGEIDKFIPGTEFCYEEADSYYKTVNVYKFSQRFSTSHYVPFLEAYCKALGNNEYYEQVLRVITLLDKPEIKALPLNDEEWYEIDDVQDLDIAESIFCTEQEQFSRLASRDGGYWRYPKMLDFSTSANPFFPNLRLKSELKANFDRLVCQPPSGKRICELLVSKCFGIPQSYLCVGNGATELIQQLFKHSKGNVGCLAPFTHPDMEDILDGELVSMGCEQTDFQYTAKDIQRYFSDKDVSSLYIQNPHQITGNYLSRNDMIELCEWAQDNNLLLCIDESHIDFSTGEVNNTLATASILNTYKNLIVLKSISKSYGIPGLRLGILASANAQWLHSYKKGISKSNINSLAEFFLQIFGKYEKQYRTSCLQFIEERNRFEAKLAEIRFLRVSPSRGASILCEIIPPKSAHSIANQLLIQHKILVKIIEKESTKNRQFISISIKSTPENDKLIAALLSLES